MGGARPMAHCAPIVAVIPAFNEELTVAKTVLPVLKSGCFQTVCVVDDGSTDTTAQSAQAAGARVLRIAHNCGKGQAMLHAVTQFPAHDVAFFDADLLGLRPDHVQNMHRLHAFGFDMVLGLRDRGAIRNCFQLAAAPLVTGQRFVKRHLVDRVPSDCWTGFSIETALNDACVRCGGRMAATFLDGVNIVRKTEKVGVLRGLWGYLTMLDEMCRAKETLRGTDGDSCSI